MLSEKLFEPQDVKNVELISLALFCNEVAVTSAREQSAGSTMGLTEHAQRRQAQYISNVRTRLDNLAKQPIPDLPASHPEAYECKFEKPEELLGKTGVALNSDASTVAQMWQLIAYELVKSNSAGLGGGLTSFDSSRAEQNVAAVEQFLIGVSEAADVDFPETAEPGAKLGSAKTRK